MNFRMRHTARLAALAVAAAAASPFVHAGPVPGQGTWETTLQARDLNTDGTADAWYDTVLNITWLANAMGTLGTPFDDATPGNGESTWDSARTWAAGLNVHGVTGWRLPRFLSSVPGPSEVSHMHCETLGNTTPGACNSGPPPWNFVNSGPFANLSNNWIWLDNADPTSGTPHAWAWAADPIAGYHASESTLSDFSAWAVHDGDVMATPVPEPATWQLMLAGAAVAGLWVRSARRRPARSAA